MPELPEVATIKNELLPHLKRKRIKDVIIKRREIIGFPNSRTFKRNLKGRVIRDIKRRGKYLIFNLDNGSQLIFHLRLSGRIFLTNAVTRDSASKARDILKYERIRFVLTGKNLSFVEPRMFGRVFLVKDYIPEVLRGFKNLGPEPLEKEFNTQFLWGKIHHRRGKIKSLLLDQTIGCGIGNIYSDEALFIARINPERRGNTLTKKEVANLVKAIKMVLREGIRYKGTTISDYLRPDGKVGGYQKRLRVKDREGKPCALCEMTIQKIKISNRSTNFCPKCQR